LIKSRLNLIIFFVLCDVYRQVWYDDRLMWNHSETYDVQDILVTTQDIWVPDVVLINK